MSKKYIIPILMSLVTLVAPSLLGKAFDAVVYGIPFWVALFSSLALVVIQTLKEKSFFKEQHSWDLIVILLIVAFILSFGTLVIQSIRNGKNINSETPESVNYQITIPFEETLAFYGEENATIPITGEVDLEMLNLESISLQRDDGTEVPANINRKQDTLVLSKVAEGSYTLHLKFSDYEESVISISAQGDNDCTLPEQRLTPTNTVGSFYIYLKRANEEGIPNVTCGLSIRNASDTTYTQALNNLITDAYGAIPIVLTCKQGTIFDLSWTYGGKSGKETIKVDNEYGNMECILPINDEAEREFFENSNMSFDIMNGTEEFVEKALMYWNKDADYGLNNLNYPEGRLAKITLWRAPSEEKKWKHVDARITCTIPEHIGAWDFKGILIAAKELENSPSHAKIQIIFNNKTIATTELSKSTPDEFHFSIHANPGDADRFFIVISADVAYEHGFYMGFVLPHENQAVEESSTAETQ